MSYATRFALAAAFAVVSMPALASEADFLKRFHGSFSGSGHVRVNGDTHAITCRMSGSATASSVNMRGTCSAGMVSKNISASLRASGNGRYSGSYNGVDGSASLSGRRKGNSIVLSIGGAKPGTMTISNSGSSIALSVVSNQEQTTRVSLARRGGAQVASIAE